eukprot:9032279-Ditylum_brightwellii.AAC.1
MDLWGGGKFAALVDNTVTEGWTREGQQRVQQEDDALRHKQYHNTVLEGKLRSAVQQVTDWGGGRVLFQLDKCTKTGEAVEEVLQGKHPATWVMCITNLEYKSFEKCSGDAKLADQILRGVTCLMEGSGRMDRVAVQHLSTMGSIPCHHGMPSGGTGQVS